MPTKYRSSSASPFEYERTPTRSLNVMSNSSTRRSRSLDNKQQKSPIVFRIRDIDDVSPRQYQHKKIPSSSSKSSSSSEAFDPWESFSLPSSSSYFSPTSVTETSSFFPIQTEKQSSKKQSHRKNKKQQRRTSTITSTNQKQCSQKRQPLPQRIIPGVSKMTMHQSLAVIFSAFWERADLYTDVLGLKHDKPTLRQLRLAFFRQGREVLASPIENPDDMTTISAALKPPVFACSISQYSNPYENGIVKSSVQVSRKAKLKFQAINLAYQLLKDESNRKIYDKWRMCNSRLPNPASCSPPSSPFKAPCSPIAQEISVVDDPSCYGNKNRYKPLSNKELNEILNVGGNVDRTKQLRYKNYVDSPDSSNISIDVSSAMGCSVNSKSSLPSILKKSKFGKNTHKNMPSTLSAARTPNRKITWNEDVEEFVILERSRETSDDKQQENVDARGTDIEDNNNISDPYTNEAYKDDWFFGTDVHFDSTSKSKNDKQLHAVTLGTDPDREEPGQISFFNFKSLNDSSMAVFDSSTPLEAYNDRVYSKPKIQINSTSWTDNVVKQMQATQFVKKAADDNAVNELNPKQSPRRSRPNVLCDETGVKNNVRIGHETVDAAEDMSIYSKETYVTRETYDTKETYDSSWKSYNTRETYDSSCKSYGFECLRIDQAKDYIMMNRECFSIDITKGFQATLSNYINAAVSDMKEGLFTLGDMLERRKSSERADDKKKGENPLLIQSFEIDAMMDILKTEMENVTSINKKNWNRLY